MGKHIVLSHVMNINILYTFALLFYTELSTGIFTAIHGNTQPYIHVGSQFHIKVMRQSN